MINCKLVKHEAWVKELNSGNISARELLQSALNDGLEFAWHPLGFIICKLSDDGRKKFDCIFGLEKKEKCKILLG